MCKLDHTMVCCTTPRGKRLALAAHERNQAKFDTMQFGDPGKDCQHAPHS